MPINYLGSKEFRETLNEWLVSRGPKAADRLNGNKGQIPSQLRNYTKTLFLPMVVNDDFINKANVGRGRVDEFSLWTKDSFIARQHSRNMVMSQGEYKVMISKTVPPRDQIIDLDEFITFVGIPQLTMFGFDGSALTRIQDIKSVLVADTISITRTDYDIVDRYGSKPEKTT